MLDHALKTPAIQKDAAHHHWAGLLLAFGGAIALSFKAIFVKLAFAAGGTALSLTILRMSLALPVFAAVALWSAARLKRRITVREFAAAALLGCIGNYLSAYLDFAGLQHVSANVERIVLFLYPTLVVLINRWWLKTPIAPRTLMGFALSYGGIWLVFMSQPDHGGGSGHFAWGATLVLLSALTYACYLVFSGPLIRALGALAFTSIAMSASCLVSMASALAMGPKAIYGQPVAVYGYALALALICTVAPLFMISAAIRKVGADSVAAMGTTGPLATIVLSAWLLGEQLTAAQGAGMVVVVIGVLIVGAKPFGSKPIGSESVAPKSAVSQSADSKSVDTHSIGEKSQ